MIYKSSEVNLQKEFLQRPIVNAILSFLSVGGIGMLAEKYSPISRQCYYGGFYLTPASFKEINKLDPKTLYAIVESLVLFVFFFSICFLYAQRYLKLQISQQKEKKSLEDKSYLCWILGLLLIFFIYGVQTFQAHQRIKRTENVLQ
jgi:hypothetical protein